MSKVRPLTFPGRLFVAETVRVTLRREARRFTVSETGGILLGYRTDENDLVVTEATGPGPGARHRRNSFEPDTAYCQARMTAAYERTGGAISYLGEWHTHPHGSTRPSRQDLRSMLALADDPSVRQPEPLLWIYRPRRRLLMWDHPEELFVAVLDREAVAWQWADVLWLATVPDIAAPGMTS